MSSPGGMDPADFTALANGDSDDVQNVEVEVLTTDFARLRDRRENIAKERTIDLPIPGYDGELIARYQRVEYPVIRRIIEKMQKQKAATGDRADLYAMIDTIVAACKEILYKSEDGKLTRLSPNGPVRFDRTLAEGLGFQAETARQIVLEVFNNELAIGAHHSDLMEWLQGEAKATDEEFLGESAGLLPSGTQPSA